MQNCRCNKIAFCNSYEYPRALVSKEALTILRIYLSRLLNSGGDTT
jgi:hypothetical protein